MAVPSQPQVHSATLRQPSLSHQTDHPDSLVSVQMLSVVAVAKCLDWSDERIRQLIRSGELKAVRLGGSTRIRLTDLIEFIDNLPSAREGRKAVTA